VALLDAGAPVDMEGQSHHTALTLAAARGKVGSDAKVANRLLEEG
jgi:hypothetical protein